MVSNSGTHSEPSLFEAHQRSFETNRYVYPVLSRRSGGISIGINLSPDQVCNFHCIYCQVDRSERQDQERIDLDRLAEELEQTVELVLSRRIYEGTKFATTPEPLRRLNDIAFSGNGEPTLSADFEKVVALCAQTRARRNLETVKLVLITNASLLDKERVRRALEILDANQGEIWAKLDAGTESYYRQVARSRVPFRRILDNLTEAARRRPIVIQSLFMRIDDRPPTDDELTEYCRRLRDVVERGGRIKLVQAYTVSRPPAESYVAALSDGELDAVAERIRRETGLAVEAFYA